MFRCETCGSGYSTQAASSWQFCPRCLARDKVNAPLTFELGWQRSRAGASREHDEHETALATRPGSTGSRGAAGAP